MWGREEAAQCSQGVNSLTPCLRLLPAFLGLESRGRNMGLPAGAVWFSWCFLRGQADCIFIWLCGCQFMG